jgi:hypothetical protein
MLRSFVLALCLCVLLQVNNAFAPRTQTFRRASCVTAAKPPAARVNSAFVLRMAEEDKEGEKAKVSADGTFYDDEVSSTR